MANHGFVTTRKQLNHERLIKLLNQINEERFKGALKIEPWKKTAEDGRRGVSITMDRESNYIPLWLASQRKIEIRHQARGLVAEWVDCLITHELAKRLDGMISDEGCGVDERWPGEPDKYATMGIYKEAMTSWARTKKDRHAQLARWFAYEELLRAHENLAKENPKLLPFVDLPPKPRGKSPWEKMRENQKLAREKKKE